MVKIFDNKMLPENITCIAVPPADSGGQMRSSKNTILVVLLLLLFSCYHIIVLSSSCKQAMLGVPNVRGPIPTPKIGNICSAFY